MGDLLFNTTLCYLEQDDNYLMLHRIKKEHDINHDKWVGVGGKFEEGESPEECALREVKEETGLTMHSWNYRGIVTFVSDQYEAESMHLFTSSDFSGNLIDCDEGVLEWVPIDHVPSLPLWTGDLIFFRLLREDRPFFSLKLQYEGDKLVYAALDGTAIPCSPDF